MSVKHALLALLVDRLRYGYDLKLAFQACTGGAWPLNVGQVYTTLQRAERDGQVAHDHRDMDGHVLYRLTDVGRAEVDAWWAQPVSHGSGRRDEVVLKLALASCVPDADVRGMCEEQRAVTLGALERLRQRSDALHDEEDAAHFVVDRLISQAQSELRWLEHLEAVLQGYVGGRQPSRTGASSRNSRARLGGGNRPSAAS